MNAITDHVTLAVVCGMVILSHFYESICRSLRIPSVLLLLATGLTLRVAADFCAFSLNLQRYVTLLGIVGLIMIVLEGTLDIKLSRRNLPVLASGLFLALATFLVSSAGVFCLLSAWIPSQTPRTLLVNAVPLSVVSSAIAIPAVRHLDPRLKEFVTYESAFSDIIGITVFNLLVTASLSPRSIMTASLLNTVGVVTVSVISSLALLVLIRKLTRGIKFTLILAVLILLYSLGKIFHVSALFLVFIFGLLLNNTHLYSNMQLFRILGLSGVEREREQFKVFIGETTFLLRTFFFILFGFMMDISGIWRFETVLIGSAVIAIILITRRLFFKAIHKDIALPALFIAPRGLVTILLFYSIPKEMRASYLEQGVLLFVIVVTNLLMLAGTLHKNSKPSIPDCFPERFS